MTVNLKNVNILIDHYQQGGGVPSWGWEDCAAGVLQAKGIIRHGGAYPLADALGIDSVVASRLVYGITMAGYDPWRNQRMVLKALASIRDTGNFVWEPADGED